MFGVVRDLLIDPSYIEIPMLGKYYITTGSNKFYATFGPSVGIGIVGNAETKITSDNQTIAEKQSIKWGSSSDDDLNRFEYGLNLGLGVQLKSIEIGVTYQYSATDSAPINDSGREIKHRLLQLSLGYHFIEKPSEN